MLNFFIFIFVFSLILQSLSLQSPYPIPARLADLSGGPAYYFAASLQVKGQVEFGGAGFNSGTRGGGGSFRKRDTVPKTGGSF